MSENEFVQPLSRMVTNITEDQLTDFQKMVSGIPDLVRLTFGEPGFDVDDTIKRAIVEAVEDNNSHYAESQGDSTLRQAVIDYFNQKYDLNYQSIDNVIVTEGVSEAINVVLMALLNPGDGLIMPEPVYSAYFPALDIAHGKQVKINTRPDDFKVTPASVEKALAEADVQVKAILLNYPNNPTGVTYTKAELQALAEVFKKHQLWVISDEIYAELTYDQDHVSLASMLPEQTILLNGLSKSHAMTGYRVGFIMGPVNFIEQAQKIHEALVFALPGAIQAGATAALTQATDAPEKMKAIYKQRRDWLVPKLEELGFEVAKPSGAFYVFAKIPEKMGHDGFAFAKDLAFEGKVAVIPGGAFSDDTKNYVRISYAASDEDLHEGIRRMQNYFAKQDK
ncbi:aminotransferase [Weissella uvarum]|uniref:aminotransferase class I/II-fold pyridoxal phosphate-dependent enzyme n=1 Tax=Weissella uvarum TaxID=1479233 RepID=UPI0019603CED|nr:aminotransferase class I/II-fold pyridoxal phosphate-dependent enzyme [Weissella uvarum]MBM7617175.1 aminotransferase [Weissella uvarum]MCM0595471.1 aminotransferase class I/II-fold pyridoxal phosphate-dependent enzyme [Weissella uvarum]